MARTAVSRGTRQRPGTRWTGDARRPEGVFQRVNRQARQRPIATEVVEPADVAKTSRGDQMWRWLGPGHNVQPAVPSSFSVNVRREAAEDDGRNVVVLRSPRLCHEHSVRTWGALHDRNLASRAADWWPSARRSRAYRKGASVLALASRAGLDGIRIAQKEGHTSASRGCADLAQT